MQGTYDLLVGLGGTAIILTVALDVFRSLLVPRASTRVLRIAPLLTLGLFSAWQATADRIPRQNLRQTIRASFAPLTLVLTFAAWSALLILGFAMLFWADRTHFVPGLASFGEAIYAAGSAFSTLGINATVSGNTTRAAVVVCSVAGLTVVTVVATFLISIQTSYARREALVLRLESHVTLPPAGIAILETYAREAIIGRLGPFFDAWETWAAEVAISHRAFPVMLFFRSNDSRCEWLAALGAVLDAAALLDTTLDDMPNEAVAGAHFVLRTGARVLRDMAAQFAVATDAAYEPANETRFDAHRERLRVAGYALLEDRDASLARFIEHRKGYAANLAALGHRLHIAVDERSSEDEDSRPVD